MGPAEPERCTSYTTRCKGGWSGESHRLKQSDRPCKPTSLLATAHGQIMQARSARLRGISWGQGVQARPLQLSKTCIAYYLPPIRRRERKDNWWLIPSTDISAKWRMVNAKGQKRLVEIRRQPPFCRIWRLPWAGQPQGKLQQITCFCPYYIKNVSLKFPLNFLKTFIAIVSHPKHWKLASLCTLKVVCNWLH